MTFIKNFIKAGLFILMISLIMQCSDGEELIPNGNCKPEMCEFKVRDDI